MENVSNIFRNLCVTLVHGTSLGTRCEKGSSRSKGTQQALNILEPSEKGSQSENNGSFPSSHFLFNLLNKSVLSRITLEGMSFTRRNKKSLYKREGKHLSREASHPSNSPCTTANFVARSEGGGGHPLTNPVPCGRDLSNSLFTKSRHA